MKKKCIYEIIILISIVTLAFYIRFIKCSESFDGFHAMNEGWYTGIAKNFERTGFLHPTPYGNTPDNKFRPIFPLLIFFSFKIFGESEMAARIPAIFFSTLSIIFVYGIMKKTTGFTVLYTSFLPATDRHLPSVSNSTTLTPSILSALYAASLLAVSPVYTLVGRNAQPDAVYVCFTLAALYFYILSRINQKKDYHHEDTKSQRTSRSFTLLRVFVPLWQKYFSISQSPNLPIFYNTLSGILIALAFLTKNPALMILPAIIIWEFLEAIKKNKTKNSKIIYPFAYIPNNLLSIFLPFLLVLLPLVIYKLTTNIDDVVRTYQNSALQLPQLKILPYITKEIFWGLSPLTTIFLVFALFFISTKIFRERHKGTKTGVRGQGIGDRKNQKPKSKIQNRMDFLLFLIFFFFLLFYLLQHVHSYYMLGFVPFAIMILARYLSAMKNPLLRNIIFWSIFSASLCYSILILCAVKYGENRFIQIKNFLQEEKKYNKDETLLLFSHQLYGNYEPTIRYYLESPYTIIASKENFETFPNTTELNLGKNYTNIYLFDIYGGNWNQQTAETQYSYIHYISEENYGIACLNYNIFLIPSNKHSFIPAKFMLVKKRHFVIGCRIEPVAKRYNIIITKIPPRYKIHKKDNNYILQYGG